MPLRISLFLLAAGIVGFFRPTAQAEKSVPRPEIRHVVLITIDGMRPDFYLSPSFRQTAPFLQAMAKSGANARGALPAYPSVTYPGHANISTGVRPHRHGVVSGTYFQPPTLDGRGQWYTGDLKAPSIWQRAAAAGLTVAAFSWPSSATAPEISWNFPEFWGSMRGSELRQILRRATPEILDLADELFGDEWTTMLGKSLQRDSLITRLAEETIVRHRPNLVLIHLLEPDTAQHKSGPSSPQAHTAVKRTDALLRRLHKTVQKAGLAPHTVFIVTGDHGQTDVGYMVAPNVLLAENGFIRIEDKQIVDWTAMAEITSGSAGVYLKDPANSEVEEAVRRLLEERRKSDFDRDMFRIVSRRELDALGTAPAAAFYLEGIPPFMFSGSVSGNFVRNATLRGNHGYLPTMEDMHTGFLAFGPGIRRTDIDLVELIDIAPTIAAVLGFDMPDVEGRVLTEILD